MNVNDLVNSFLSSFSWNRRVDDQKEAERQAHLQRRMEEASRAGRGHVDPYRLSVERGASEVADPAEHSCVEPPTLPADFGAMHVFYSAETAGVLLDKINAALTEMKDTPVVTLKRKAAKVGPVTYAPSPPHSASYYFWLERCVNKACDTPNLNARNFVRIACIDLCHL